MPRLHIINASIVDKIIGDMLWDPDEVESESHTKMMQPLIDIADGSEDLEDGEVVDRYRVITRSPCNSTLLLDIWQLHARFVRVLVFAVYEGFDRIGFDWVCQ